MTAGQLQCDVFEIPRSEKLDQIVVYWRNFGEGRGSVVVTCWGDAWTAYFGAMPEETVQQFFAKCDAPYLVNRMGLTPQRKPVQKRHLKHLENIVQAIRAALEVAR